MEDDNILEQDFTSDERLIEIWSDEFPGITNFPDLEPSSFLQFDGSDIMLVNRLANSSPSELVNEMKALKNIASLLEVEEQHERLRGKILRVLLD